MIYNVTVLGEFNFGLVEGKDAYKEIKKFLIARGFPESGFTIEKFKPKSIEQFKNDVLKCQMDAE
jgi:hypothetical protein